MNKYGKIIFCFQSTTQNARIRTLLSLDTPLGTELYVKPIKRRYKVQGNVEKIQILKRNAKVFHKKNDTNSITFISDMQKALQIEKQNLHCVILKLLDLD